MNSVNLKPEPGVSAVLLAGGQGERMGQDKAWVSVHEVPMAIQVILRLVNQVDEVLISANELTSQASFSALSYQVVSDQLGSGPLAGIYAAMQVMHHEWLVVAPCDVPNVPFDLVNRLMDGMVASTSTPPSEKTHRLRYVHDGHRDQYLCMLIHHTLRDEVKEQLEQGDYAVKRFIKKVSGMPVDFSHQAEAFTNINTQEDLARYGGK